MISDIEAVILGLISSGSNYGYSIQRTIEFSNIREWTKVSDSSIYTILRRLKKDDLITSKRETVSGRSRNIYILTERGKEELIEKLRLNLSYKEKVISSFDVSISRLNMLSKEEVNKSLGEYMRSINDRIERYIVRRDQIDARYVDKDPGMFYLRGLCDRHIAMLEAEKKWLSGYVTEINNKMR